MDLKMKCYNLSSCYDMCCCHCWGVMLVWLFAPTRSTCVTHCWSLSWRKFNSFIYQLHLLALYTRVCQYRSNWNGKWKCDGKPKKTVKVWCWPEEEEDREQMWGKSEKAQIGNQTPAKPAWVRSDANKCENIKREFIFKEFMNFLTLWNNLRFESQNSCFYILA